jgi:hypothetical protein
VRYELGFYIPEDGILHSHRRENLKSYIHPITFGNIFTLEYKRWQLRGSNIYPRALLVTVARLLSTEQSSFIDSNLE